MAEEALVDQEQTIVVKSPRPHQISALQDLYNASRSMDRYTCVMACGTGKTLTAMWHAEQIKAKSILILLPSLGLLNQTLGEWLKNTTIKSFRYLCVCSDQTVGTEEDLLQFMPGDLSFQVTTQAKQVSQFLKSAQSHEVTIIFSTYHSAEVVGLGLKNDFIFDLIVYDEAHKTVSQSGNMFSYALFDNNIKAHKRLFLTATPRVINKNQSQQQNAKPFISMDNTFLYGDYVSTLNFRKAVSLDIIVDYKIVISVVTSEMVKNVLHNSSLKFHNKKVDTLSVAHLLAIQHAVKEHNIKKLITFHSKIKIAEFFNEIIDEHWFDLLKDFNSFHVSGAMPANAREKNINNFRNSNKSVLTNARCLTEGVDVPTVDMVAFLCNKKSRVDIVQALGRVMRKSLGKRQGYILIPFYVDSDKGENFLEDSIKYSDYSEILHVLKVLADYDDSLSHIINASYEEVGEYGSVKNDIFKSKLSILASNDLDINLLKQSIATVTVNNIGNKWNYYYGLLKKFKEEYGHCNVLQRSDIGHWISKQRDLYRKNDLIIDRVDKLNALGFVWDPIEAAWEEKFNQLKKFKDICHHLNVPTIDPEYTSLRGWIMNQRTYYKQNNIAANRVKKLEEIGFVWKVYSSAWDIKYIELQEFKDIHGHCDVLQDSELGQWVTVQRGCYKKNRLSAERLEKLNALGFIWDVNDFLWDRKYNELCEFESKYNHCNVSKDNKSLNTWLLNQKAAYRNNMLDADRVEKLKSLGIVFDFQNELSWNQKYNSLEKFKQEHGHCNVPSKNSDYYDLSCWLIQQRSYYRKSELEKHRVLALNELGIVWDPKEFSWDSKYLQLIEFQKETGHADVPKRHELGDWVLDQRKNYKKGKLDPDRIVRLNKIGFCWNPLDKDWDKKYILLKDFYDAHGHSKIPFEPHLKSLYDWSIRQRDLYKKGKLSEDRVSKLNELKFSWDALLDLWNERYEDLIKFEEKNGNLKVLSSTILGRWIRKQKNDYGENKLSEKRLLKLQEINFFERT